MTEAADRSGAIVPRRLSVDWLLEDAQAIDVNQHRSGPPGRFRKMLESLAWGGFPIGVDREPTPNELPLTITGSCAMF